MDHREIIAKGNSVNTKSSSRRDVICVTFSEPVFSKNFDLFAIATGVFLVFASLFSELFRTTPARAAAIILVVIGVYFLSKAKDRLLRAHARSNTPLYTYEDLKVVEPNLTTTEEMTQTNTNAVWRDKDGTIFVGVMSCRTDIFGKSVYSLTSRSVGSESDYDSPDLSTPWFDVRDSQMIQGRYWVS